MTNPLDEAEASGNWDQSEFERMAMRHIEGNVLKKTTSLQTISAIRHALVEFALKEREESASQNEEGARWGLALDWKQAARLLKKIARQESCGGAASKASEY